MSKTPINNLTKEQFLKEFEELVFKLPQPNKLNVMEFLYVLLAKGIITPQKYLEFTK